MGRVLLYGIVFVVVLYAFIDVVQSRGEDVRALPKALWAVLVVIVPLVGAAAWFVFGRPVRAGSAPGPLGRRPRGPVAPDDDPAFLRHLDDETWTERMRRRRETDKGGDGTTAGGPGPVG